MVLEPIISPESKIRVQSLPPCQSSDIDYTLILPSEIQQENCLSSTVHLPTPISSSTHDVFSSYLFPYTRLNYWKTVKYWCCLMLFIPLSLTRFHCRLPTLSNMKYSRIIFSYIIFTDNHSSEHADSL